MKTIEDAIALATTLSGGLLSYGDSRPAIKPLNPGKAAENGVFAAMLAKEGVKGPTEALEGPNGWFHAVTDEIKDSYLDAIIIGASKLDHLVQNMAAVKAGPLPDDIVKHFDTAWAMCKADSPEYFTLYKKK